MFDHFTERARKATVAAREAANRLHHDYIGTAHLLLGILSQESCSAVQVLRHSGIELSAVAAAVERVVSKGRSNVDYAHLPISPNGHRVLEAAREEAQGLRHSHIGTEHLLLGLIRVEEGGASRVLRELGATVDCVRAQVLQMIPADSASSLGADRRGSPTSGGDGRMHVLAVAADGTRTQINTHTIGVALGDGRELIVGLAPEGVVLRSEYREPGGDSTHSPPGRTQDVWASLEVFPGAGNCMHLGIETRKGSGDEFVPAATDESRSYFTVTTQGGRERFHAASVVLIFPSGRELMIDTPRGNPLLDRVTLLAPSSSFYVRFGACNVMHVVLS